MEETEDAVCESDNDPVLIPVPPLAAAVVEGLALQLILWTIKLRQSRLEPAAFVIEGM